MYNYTKNKYQRKHYIGGDDGLHRFRRIAKSRYLLTCFHLFFCKKKLKIKMERRDVLYPLDIFAKYIPIYVLLWLVPNTYTCGGGIFCVFSLMMMKVIKKKIRE